MSIHYTLQTALPHTKFYEFAAWFTTGVVQAGSYEAEVSFGDGFYGTSSTHCPIAPGKRVSYVYLSLPGTVTEDYFQSHYGGMCIGESYDRTQNAGKDFTFPSQFYGYEVAESIAHDDRSRWSIDDDWEVKCENDCANHSLLRVE